MITIYCTGCNKDYAVHEEKVPADLRCPACGSGKAYRKAPAAPADKPVWGKELMAEIVRTSKALPPMPQIIMRAMDVLSSDNAGFKEVGEVLEADQAMAARVLKLANSAYYGLSVPVSSVQQASAILGFQTLFQMITVVSSSKMMGQRIEGYGMPARDVWKHSLRVAFGAKAIAEQRFAERVNDAFLAGLIHDAGKLILDPRVQQEIESFQALIVNGKSIQETETELFGFDHAEIAAEYLKKWNLPANQIHAIRFHHDPSGSGGDMLSFVLHAADAMASRNDPEMQFILEDDILSTIGFAPEELNALHEQVESTVDQIMEGLGG